MILTDRFLQGLKSENGQRAEHPDGKVKGLFIRVTPTGSKSWALRYCRKADGKQRRMTIGSYPDLKLERARTKARAFLSRVAEGDDPADTERRPKDGKPQTFGQLAERYLASHATKKKSGREDESQLRNDVLPALGGRPLGGIHRADVAAILDSIIARGAPIRANRTFATIRKIFNWGIETGLIETTPIAKMKPPANEKSRERILSADEIRTFWRRTIAKTDMDWQMRLLLRLCLVTGQRISEVAGATRDELHLHKAEWHIGSDRTKNGFPLIVPLSPFAVRLFEKALARSAHDVYLLPSRLTKRPMLKSAPSMSMRRAMPILSEPMLDGTKVFTLSATPHDLRRTLASGLGEMGYSRFIQDKVLNHTTGERRVSAVYDRYEYLREKREALEAWAAHLEGLLFRARRKPGIIIQRSAASSPRASSPWARV